MWYLLILCLGFYYLFIYFDRVLLCSTSENFYVDLAGLELTDCFYFLSVGIKGASYHIWLTIISKCLPYYMLKNLMLIAPTPALGLSVCLSVNSWIATPFRRSNQDIFGERRPDFSGSSMVSDC